MEKLIVKELKNISKSLDELAKIMDKGLESSKKEITSGKTADKNESEKTKELSLEDVRKILASKSKDGHTAAIKEILMKYDAEKLSELDPKRYQSVLDEVEAL